MAGTKSELVRFGIAMERDLLERLDAIADERGVTRSEILRDLARAEVVRAQVTKGAPAVATLTLVYDHHVRELTEKLTEFQHQLGDRVRSTLHVHLDERRCLEVVILRGRSDELKRVADRLLATRGVTHGGIEIVVDEEDDALGHGHDAHGHDHDAQGHSHSHERSVGHGRAPAAPAKRLTAAKRSRGHSR
jgi:CopG family transcriptional regulator, nickel-responsive regulator